MKQVQHLVQLTFGDDDGFPLKNFRLDFLSAVVHTFVTTKKQKMMKKNLVSANYDQSFCWKLKVLISWFVDVLENGRDKETWICCQSLKLPL